MIEIKHRFIGNLYGADLYGDGRTSRRLLAAMEIAATGDVRRACESGQ